MIATEDQIMEKIRRGDKEAFHYLVSQYRNKGFGLCYSIVGNVEDAKDILQDGFVKVYTNIKYFKGESSFYTWFYRILVNACRDFLRKNSRKKTSNIDNHALSQGPAGNPAVKQEIREELASAVSSLPEKQRLCFIMKHMRGLKIDEIATVMKCKPSTIKVHLFRAVGKLRKGLKEYTR